MDIKAPLSTLTSQLYQSPDGVTEFKTGGQEKQEKFSPLSTLRSPLFNVTEAKIIASDY